MSQIVLPLRGGQNVLVCNDMDDHTVWENAVEHDCPQIVMLEKGQRAQGEWLAANVDWSAVKAAGGARSIRRPVGRGN